MGAGRHTQTVLVDSSSQGSNFQHRGLRPGDLGAVIFVCNGETMQECLDKQLLGLPRPHIVYVQHIADGMPLFLFNYDDRSLRGVFAAVGSGALLIDPHAWSPNGKSPTRYPAQVRFRLEMQCAPLPEKVFSRVIKDNYFAAGRFFFELTRKQMQELVALFFKGKMAASCKATVQTLPAAPPLPPPPPPPPQPPVNAASAVRVSAATTAWKKVVKEIPPPAQTESILPPLPPPSSDTAKVAEDTEWDGPAVQPPASQEPGILEGILEKLQVITSTTVPVPVPVSRETGHQAEMAFQAEKLALPASESVLDPSVAKVVEKSVALCLEAAAEMRETELRLSKTMEELRVKGECLKELDAVRKKNLELADAGVALAGQVQELRAEVAVLQRLATSQALYLIGGSNGEKMERSVDKFVPRTGKLSQTAPLLAPRSCSAAGVLNGNIYVFGGTIRDRSVSSTEVYVPEENLWKLSLPMKTARAYMGGVVIGNMIFALGGRDGSDFYSDTESFDLERGWMASVPMLERRGAFSPVVLGGSIYAFGGTDGSLYLDSAERLDPREGSWNKLPAMTLSRLWFQSVAWNDKVYVFGGHDGRDYLASVERFDARAGKWETIKPLACGRAHGAAAVVDGTICVIAGLDKKHHFVNTIECYREDSSSRLIQVCDLSNRSLFSLGVV